MTWCFTFYKSYSDVQLMTLRGGQIYEQKQMAFQESYDSGLSCWTAAIDKMENLAKRTLNLPCISGTTHLWARSIWIEFWAPNDRKRICGPWLVLLVVLLVVCSHAEVSPAERPQA